MKGKRMSAELLTAFPDFGKTPLSTLIRSVQKFRFQQLQLPAE